MNQSQILDYLERAYNVGIFTDVLKMIRSNSEKVLIEKVLEKAEGNPHRFDPLRGLGIDFFGAD